MTVYKGFGVKFLILWKDIKVYNRQEFIFCMSGKVNIYSGDGVNLAYYSADSGVGRGTREEHGKDSQNSAKEGYELVVSVNPLGEYKLIEEPVQNESDVALGDSGRSNGSLDDVFEQDFEALTSIDGF